MKFLPNFKVIVSNLVLASTLSTQALPPKYLIDTRGLLAKKYAHCEPYIILLETGFLKNLYLFGDDSHAVVKLLKILFHMVDDANFVPSKRGIAAHLTPKLTGSIIGYLEKQTTSKKLNDKNLVQTIAQHKDLEGPLKAEKFKTLLKQANTLEKKLNKLAQKLRVKKFNPDKKKVLAGSIDEYLTKIDIKVREYEQQRLTTNELTLQHHNEPVGGKRKRNEQLSVTKKKK